MLPTWLSGERLGHLDIGRQVEDSKAAEEKRLRLDQAAVEAAEEEEGGLVYQPAIHQEKERGLENKIAAESPSEPESKGNTKYNQQVKTPRASSNRGRWRSHTKSSRNRSSDGPDNSNPTLHAYTRRRRLASEAEERVYWRNLGGYEEWLSRRDKIRENWEARPFGGMQYEHLMTTDDVAVDERFDRFLGMESNVLSRGEFEGIVGWVNNEPYRPGEEKHFVPRDPWDW